MFSLYSVARGRQKRTAFHSQYHNIRPIEYVKWQLFSAARGPHLSKLRLVAHNRQLTAPRPEEKKFQW